jgi:hypothetical protein
METITFAKSLRYYDSKKNIKPKITPYPDSRKKLVLNSSNGPDGVHSDKKFTAKHTQRTHRQTSANVNSAISNRRSMPVNLWSSTDAYVDRISDQRIFDRQFRIESFTRSTLDTKHKLQSIKSDSNDEFYETTGDNYLLSSRKKLLSNMEPVLNPRKLEIPRTARIRSGFFEKIHLPTLDVPSSSKLDVQYGSQANRANTGTTNNRYQTNYTNRKQNYNNDSSNSEESFSCEIIPIQKKTYVLKLEDHRQVSARSKNSNIFEVKACDLKNSKSKYRSFHIENKLEHDTNNLVHHNHQTELGNCDLIDDMNENDAKHLVKANQKCTEWLEKYWEPQENFKNDTDLFEFDYFL